MHVIKLSLQGTYICAGEAKEEPLSTTGHIHAMSTEACEEGKELLLVEQKGNAMYASHY